nr:copia protein [Tanacetum cinerariifolium]
GLHKGYDRFQSLLSQLKTHGAGVSTEDANQKFLRTLPSSWSQVSLIMRTKPGVDTLNFDDPTTILESLNLMLKVLLDHLLAHRMWHLFLLTTLAVLMKLILLLVFLLLLAITHKRKPLHHTLMTLCTLSLLINPVVRNWIMKILNRSKRNQDSRRRDAGNTGYKARDNGKRSAKRDKHKAMVTIDGEGVDWSGHAKDETEDCALMAFNSSNSGSGTEVTSCSKVCEESYAKFKKLYDEQREQLGVASIEIQAYTLALKKVEAQLVCLSKLLNSQMSAKDKYGLGSSDVEDSHVNDRFAKVERMHAVPPPMTGNYMPPKSNFGIDESKFTYALKQSTTSESDAKISDLDFCKSSSSEETLETVPKPIDSKPKVVNEPKVWIDAPIIEEYESDSDDEYVSKALVEQDKPSCAFINTVKHVKTPRKTIQDQDTCSQNPKVDKRDWTGLKSKKVGLEYGFAKKACFVCGSFSHLIRDCDFHEKRIAKQIELNKQNGKSTGRRENRPVWNNVQRLNHQNKFVPTAVLTKTGRFLVNAARQIFTSQAASTHTARKVNTARPIDNPHQTLKGKGIVDSGCSRHMTGNKAYLGDYQDFNGGHVAFGGSKGQITGKGKIKTKKLDFEDVYFVKELQHFNLFSVSQMSDKKNKVLFTDTECLVLSPDCKLPDDNQALLRVPRQHNMYSFNLEKIVPSGGLAYLFAKATVDKSTKCIGGNWEKWVYRKKKDERGVVVRNKARLVTQGHRQEEEIDYDEVFALVARIEAIGIFLDFASYMGFIVYQMDVKSAFLYGKIDEEVYVSQPPGFIDPKFPNKVYKVVKALRGLIDKTLFIKKDKKDIMLVQVYVDDIIFCSTKKSWCDEFETLMKNRFQMSSMGELTFFLGLQVKQKEDGIFISRDKYVAEILKKFDFLSVKTASTPIETKKPLVKDEKAVDVDVHLCRSMIGSLMYLNASRPDIMHHFIRDAYEKKLIQKSYCSSYTYNCQLKVNAARLKLTTARVYVVEGWGYEKTSDKLTFYKAFFSSQWKFLIHTILQCLTAKTTACNEFSSTMASAIICLATNQKFNFSSDIFDTPLLTKKVFANIKRKHKPKRKHTKEHEVPPTESQAEHIVPLPSPSYDPLPSGDDSLKLKELMDLCTNLSTKVLDLESEVIDIKSTYQERIEKLEGRVESIQTGRKVTDIDADVEITLEKAQAKAYNLDLDLDHQEKVLSMMDVNEEELADVEEVLKVVKAVKLMTEVVTNAGATKVNKGKAILIEKPKLLKRQAQIELDEEVARQLEAELNANINWNAVIEQVKRNERLNDAVMKYQTLKRKPLTQAQAKRNMIVYLKNIVGFKMDYIKGMTYDEIRPLFEKHYTYNQAFLDEVNEGVKVSETEVRQEKDVEVESSKREGESLEQEIAKKQKIEEETEELKKHL